MWNKIKSLLTTAGGILLVLVGMVFTKNKQLKKQVKAGKKQQERIEEALEKNSKLDEDNIKDALNNHFSH